MISLDATKKSFFLSVGAASILVSIVHFFDNFQEIDAPAKIFERKVTLIEAKIGHIGFLDEAGNTITCKTSRCAFPGIKKRNMEINLQ